MEAIEIGELVKQTVAANTKTFFNSLHTEFKAAAELGHASDCDSGSG
jgi:hypothetical protein